MSYQRRTKNGLKLCKACLRANRPDHYAFARCRFISGGKKRLQDERDRQLVAKFPWLAVEDDASV